MTQIPVEAGLIPAASTLAETIATTARGPNAAQETASEKPLGGRAYGSIPHLPKSRRGPGDYGVNDGQAKICLSAPRAGDRIIVTEKLDGACVAVAKVNGEIIPVIRAGYRATTTKQDQFLLFNAWVLDRYGQFLSLLDEGERVCGEWLAMAHGVKYDGASPAFSPFVAFDIFRDGARVLTDEFRRRIEGAGLTYAHVIHDGPQAFSIDAAMRALGGHGFHGALEKPEGAVWRVEREGRVDFLAKYVRGDKIDGLYFKQTYGATVWNWRP